jgi:hypothetical protein
MGGGLTMALYPNLLLTSYNVHHMSRKGVRLRMEFGFPLFYGSIMLAWGCDKCDKLMLGRLHSNIQGGGGERELRRKKIKRLLTECT